MEFGEKISWYMRHDSYQGDWGWSCDVEDDTCGFTEKPCQHRYRCCGLERKTVIGFAFW